MLVESESAAKLRTLETHPVVLGLAHPLIEMVHQWVYPMYPNAFWPSG